MKIFCSLALFLSLTSTSLFAQSNLLDQKELKKALKKSEKYQNSLKKEYLNPETTILNPLELKKLKDLGGFSFFELNEKYIFRCPIDPIAEPNELIMPTSTERVAKYKIYARVSFEIEGEVHSVSLLQSYDYGLDKQGNAQLFLPFTDLSSGEESYGGGRYINITHKKGDDHVIIDFNQSYQPLCSYTSGYSCPVPPKENFINHRIEAGIKHSELGGH